MLTTVAVSIFSHNACHNALYPSSYYQLYNTIAHLLPLYFPRSSTYVGANV
ncbi:hypothetical protein APHHGE2_0842 [Anaplasma phagocytophilum str. HGE2]|nr:hypothetical protein APHHGE2_0842 [Anaplasma phagocytophilum str. HGE2]